jgi:hypothetical protein
VARKAKPGTGLAAAQKYLGLVQNAKGQWVRPGAGLASRTLSTVTQKAGYSVVPGQEAITPFSSPRGQHLGTYSQATGKFTLAGGKAAGGRKAAGARKRRGKGAGGTAAVEQLGAEPVASNPFAEADVAATSLLRTQGKAFAAGRAAYAGTALGATRGPKATEKAEVAGKKKGKKGKAKPKARTRKGRK